MFAVALCTGYTHASECVGDDCELEPIVVEQNIAPMSFVEINQEQITPTLLEVSECEIEEDYCYDYNCPFDTVDECEIWYKKPEHKTYSGPRAPHFANVRVDEILYAIYANYNVDASDVSMSPLVERYQILTRASDACCGAGIIHKMRENGASDKDVYAFLKDDANYFAVIKRCMMMSNDDISSNYSHGVNGQMVADVRNACLCKNREWFVKLLQPFNDIYARMPVFREKPFAYSYRDDMQRDITVFINEDVQTTSALLNGCPR